MLLTAFPSKHPSPSATTTYQDLEEELRKAQEALRAAGVQSVATPKARPKRQLPESKEIQTEPWAPFPA